MSGSQQKITHGWRRFPIVTATLAAIAMIAHAWSPLGDWLAYDRSAVATGEVWRVLGGHLAHWNGDHLFWDVVMFVTLGVAIECRNRSGLAISVLVSALAISATLWQWHPEIAQYRGLSGIDSTLFTHAAVVWYVDARRSGRTIPATLILLSVLGFAAKLVYELITGSTWFVDASGAGFTPLASVHLVGGLMGALCAKVSIGNADRLQRSPAADTNSTKARNFLKTEASKATQLLPCECSICLYLVRAPCRHPGLAFRRRQPSRTIGPVRRTKQFGTADLVVVIERFNHVLEKTLLAEIRG